MPHLVLVAWDGRPKTWSDLRRIAELMPSIDPGVRATVVAHHKRSQLRLLPLWFRPTLSLAMIAQLGRKLLPGRFMTGLWMGKHGEYRRLDAAGIPVPEWTEIRPDMRLDPALWGPYVVVKPAIGRVGAFVRIRKTDGVRYRPPESFPADHYGRAGPMLAQRFIYTGEWPTSYRVVTLFGEVLLCYRQVSIGHGKPLASRWGFVAFGGTSIVSNTKDMKVELVEDAAVIALAERAHREAFGDLALLAFDIVRDSDTGNLFVLECHAHGTAWTFSSGAGRSIQAANGIDFESQFDAIPKAARILAQATRRLALVSPPPLWGGQVAKATGPRNAMRRPPA